MRALDVVGVDLQLRFAVDFRVRGQQQVAATHLGVGFHGGFVHHDAPGEDATAALPGDAPVMLAAAGVRLTVVEQEVGVEMAAAVDHEQSVQIAFRALPQIAVDIGAADQPAKGRVMLAQP